MKGSEWTFFSNCAHVLVYLAENPGVRLREVADRVGITERRAQRIITKLDDAGILTRVKHGRRNSYYIDTSPPRRHPIEEDCTVGELFQLVLSAPRVRQLKENQAAFDTQGARQ